MGRRDLERLRRRALRLERQATLYEAARDACHELHHRGDRMPRHVVLRRSFLLRRDNFGGRSPAVALITPKGIALQLYLVALFEAQCRRPPGTVVRNNRPLRSTAYMPGWVELLASETTQRRTEDGLLRQMKRGLHLLEQQNLAQIARRGNGIGAERFRLLDEGGRFSPIGAPVPYTLPKGLGPQAGEHRLIDTILKQLSEIDVPAEFFTRGWVHVLSPAEIVTYLMLLDLEMQHTVGVNLDGVFVTNQVRLDRYSISRDVYESHRTLCSYGLIERLDNPNRRSNGQVRRFKDVPGNPLEPHRFRVMRKGLTNDALRTVIDGLRAGPYS